MGSTKSLQYGIVDRLCVPDVVDEEVVLINVDLYTRCTAVEFQEGLGAMLLW
jgi:hypothetical protein